MNQNKENSSVENTLSVCKDDFFHLLQNKRRRAVSRYLIVYSDYEVFEMRTVAEAVAAWKNETTIEQLATNERGSVYISLYQTYLPALDEYNVIVYDQSRGIIEPTPLIPLFEPYLDAGFESVPHDQQFTISEEQCSFDVSTF